MKRHKDTRIHLVRELEALPYKDHPLIDEIIREAKAGEYHDYKNVKYVCGKVAVSNKLRHAAASLGMPSLIMLAKRVEAGEFDEKPDAEDHAQLKKDFEEFSFSNFKFKH